MTKSPRNRLDGAEMVTTGCLQSKQQTVQSVGYVFSGRDFISVGWISDREFSV